MDLRKEFKNLLKDFEGVGRWVVLRKFSKEYSENWKPETREPVGGPAYVYTEEVVETYSMPIVTRSVINTQGAEIEVPGIFDQNYIKFYFEHTIDIKMGDEIFELDYAEKNKPTVVYDDEEVDVNAGKVKPSMRYKVQKVDPMRFDGGRIEFKIAYAYKTVLR